MSQCPGCDKCEVHTDAFCESGSGSVLTHDFGILLVGNNKVGKSTLFNQICSGKKESVTVRSVKRPVEKGIAGYGRVHVYNTPGVLSIFTQNREERVARDILVPGNISDDIHGIVIVGDAKNLKRSVALALQYAEYRMPMLFVLNMVDEAAFGGIKIDTEKLAELLGIPVCETVARDGVGIKKVVSMLYKMKVPTVSVDHGDDVRDFITYVKTALSKQTLSSGALAIHLLNSDKAINYYLNNTFGNAIAQDLSKAAETLNKNYPQSAAVRFVTSYNRKAEDIVRTVQNITEPAKQSIAARLGQWCMTPLTGLPIAAVVVSLMYLFVGSLGATFLVDMINTRLFESYIIPYAVKMVAPIPSEFVRDMIVDPDFGILPTGVFLALGLVAPVLFCFYIAFGILEDSGYLSRLAILLDRAFQKMGLNGKGVVPLVMGFSCVTMAILTTRLLDTEKEKNIVSFLLLLGMPCAPLLAVMLVILDKMPISATFMVFGLIGTQILVAGFFTNKMMFGKRSPLIMEIQPIRFPRFTSVLNTSVLKTYYFMKEALPVFILASVLVFLFDRAGGLSLMEQLAMPLVNGLMGLPEKSVQVFIKTIIRRESGATEIQHLSNIYTNLQLVVNLLVMTFLSPCINATIVLIKERGIKTSMTILIAVMIYAVFIGSIVNHACRVFGVTFT